MVRTDATGGRKKSSKDSGSSARTSGGWKNRDNVSKEKNNRGLNSKDSASNKMSETDWSRKDNVGKGKISKGSCSSGRIRDGLMN